MIFIRTGWRKALVPVIALGLYSAWNETVAGTAIMKKCASIFLPSRQEESGRMIRNDCDTGRRATRAAEALVSDRRVSKRAIVAERSLFTGCLSKRKVAFQGFDVGEESVSSV